MEGVSSSRIGNQLCSLYFKGLVVGNTNSSLAGFGVAIYGEKDDILFQMKGPIHGADITVLEAELTALKRGLTESVTLGVNHISLFCDYPPVYKLITESSILEEKKSGMLLTDVQLIRQQFASSSPIFVAKKRIRHVYKLAKETTTSQISISIDPPPTPKKKTCPICMDDDIDADQMFSVYKCGHQLCSECMRRHIEVTLLERSWMRCPHYRCESRLDFTSCVSLLTPKLIVMWAQRIKEDSIAIVDRVYCPNPKCSALMSKTKLSKSTTNEGGARRSCFECDQPFCIDCRVPWHSDMGCDDYKRLHPNHTEDEEKLKALADEKMWRQCGKCQHMIELTQGCVQVICRCGHSFCYRCGANAGDCPHGHGHGLPPPQECVWCCYTFYVIVFLYVLFYIILILKKIITKQ